MCVPYTTAGVPTTYIVISLIEQPTDGTGDTCTYRAPKFKCSDERRAKKVGHDLVTAGTGILELPNPIHPILIRAPG